MKKVEAIIRTSKFEEVHAELSKIGVSFMTFSEVKGIGTEHAALLQYRGTTYDIGFVLRTQLEIVVSDDKLDTLIDCLLKSAYTGNIGDGKIFVSDIQQAYRIRSGEKGEDAL